MALWDKSQRLQGPLLEQMKHLYGPQFPIEVRHYLANWIEAQSWSDIDPDNLTHMANARRLFEAMLMALQELITTYATNFITKTQLEALFSHMKNEYINRPSDLVRVVQHCLITEAELVKRQEELSVTPSELPGNDNTGQIQILQQNIMARVEAMETMFRNISGKHENIQIHFQENQRIELMFHQGVVPQEQAGKYKERKQLLEQVMAKDSDEIHRTMEDLSRRFLECLDEVQRCHHLVVSGELSTWKQKQRLFSLEDDAIRAELNTIQRWFETLADLLWRLRHLGKQLELTRSRSQFPIFHQQQPDQFGAYAQHCTKLLQELIKESFILEKQPPQVIKTSNRFSATIRLLVGSKLQIHLSIPEVVVSIINEKQAKSLSSDPSKPFSNNFSSGEILNNQKAMEYNAQSGMLQCNFNYMQLRRIKRNTDRKATEIVMEEKFTLLFRSKFSIAGGELDIPVMCQSLPVVVIVHVTQQPAAEATIFWDNSFAEANRESFVVPEIVPWPRVAEALNNFFHAHTGRGLTTSNLDYLGRKLLGAGSDEDIGQSTVTRQQICRDQLKGRSFTFWEWFYKHLDLIKSTLKREWVEGLIEGFMDKTTAQNLLMSVQQGNFLLRFADSDPGGISVTWVSDNDNGDKQIYRLAPWGKHDLSIRCFADRLYDLAHLIFLYPNRLKDDVFGPYYTPPQTETRPDGYLFASMQIVLPGQRNTLSNPPSPAPSLYSFAGTPNPRTPPSNMSTMSAPVTQFNGGSLTPGDLTSLPDLGPNLVGLHTPTSCYDDIFDSSFQPPPT